MFTFNPFVHGKKSLKVFAAVLHILVASEKTITKLLAQPRHNYSQKFD